MRTLSTPSPHSVASRCLLPLLLAALVTGCSVAGGGGNNDGGGSDNDGGGSDADGGPSDGGDAPDGGGFDGGGPGPSCPRVESRSRLPLGDAWSVAGPPGGHVVSVLALPGGVVLVGTGYSRGSSAASPRSEGSAVYRSTDAGRTFTLRQRFANSTVRALVQVGTSDRIYAGVGSLSGALTDSVDDGVWVSDDGGSTWRNASGGLHPFARVRGLAVAPGTPERVWVMVEGTPTKPINAIPSLYRRDDGGAFVRSPLTGVDQVTGGPALAMAAHLTDRDRLFLASGDRLFESNDGGSTFSARPFGDTLFDPSGLRWVQGLFASPHEATHLVITTHDRGLFESHDTGITWMKTDLPPGGQGTVAFSPTELFVTTRGSGLQVASLTEGAASGAFATRGACAVDPVPTAVAVAPDDPAQVYLGFDGQGLLASTDGGQRFSTPAAGLDDLAARITVTGPAASPVVWILSAAGLHRSLDRGETWTRVADDQGTLAFSAVAQDPADPEHVLVGTNGDWYAGAGTSKGVFDLDPGSGTIFRVLGLSGPTPGVIGLAFDPQQPGRAFAYQQGSLYDDPAAVPTGLFTSSNGGGAFVITPMQGLTLVSHLWFTGSPLAMQSDGRLLMGLRVDEASGTVEVWRSADGGDTHAVLWSGNRNGPYAGVYVDPADAIYLAGPSPTGLFKSTDDGASFAEFGQGLSGFSAMVRDVAFAPSGAILLGTVDATYYATDGQAFVEINEGFEAFARGPETLSVAIVPGAAGQPDIAFAGTTHGVYRRRLP